MSVHVSAASPKFKGMNPELSISRTTGELSKAFLLSAIFQQIPLKLLTTSFARPRRAQEV